MNIAPAALHDLGVTHPLLKLLSRGRRPRQLAMLQPEAAADVTLAEIAADEEQPDKVRDWAKLPEAEIAANNPPSWVANEGCWARAKRAASKAGASDPWAFAAWWYIDHVGCAMKRAMPARAPGALSIELPRLLSGVEIKPDAEGKLPSAFRLFLRGDNPNRNGPPAVFDERAAELTMAYYNAHRQAPDGTTMDRPVMVDYEHLSVPGAALEILGDGRAADLKARGWADLEVREDGSLWAVNVKWTKAGEELLLNREVRFVSPAYNYEITDDGRERVTSIHNIALTAMPATDGAWELAAASTKGPSGMNLSEFLKRWGKLSVAQRSLPAKDKVLGLLAIDMKQLQAVVKAMGGDPSGDLTSLFATVSKFWDELTAVRNGEAVPSEPAAAEGETETMADNPEEPAPAMSRAAAAAEVRRVGEREDKLAAEVKLLRARQDERDNEDRIQLYRQAVADPRCRLTAGEVWQDGQVGTLKPRHARKPLDEVKEEIAEASTGLGVLSVTPRPPAVGRSDVTVTAEEDIEISEAEATRVKVKLDRNRAEAHLSVATEHHYQRAIERYEDHKRQQLRHALSRRGTADGHRLIARFGRKIELDMVLSTITGSIRHDAPKLLAATPVKPIEQYGSSSQRAMEEFRLELLGELAAALEDWTAKYGIQLTSGALKLSYPMHFQTTGYEEVTGQGPQASTPQSRDIQVTQRKWSMAMQANLERMMGGDHAYIRSWQQQAAQMARSRVKKRREILVAELQSNPLWAKTDQEPNGLDGQKFFTQTGRVNPFKASLGTQSNLSVVGHPLAPLSTGADSLTLEQATWPEVKSWDGVDMEQIATDLMVPTNLGYYARQLLDVKEAILRGALSGGGDGTMGPEPNEHKNSGVSWFTAAPLSKAADGGTGASSLNAIWYMLSAPIIAMGFEPWAMCEGDTDELREWGTDSDFYKNGPGDIKIASFIKLCVVLVHRQGIRKVYGLAP